MRIQNWVLALSCAAVFGIAIPAACGSSGGGDAGGCGGTSTEEGLSARDALGVAGRSISQLPPDAELYVIYGVLVQGRNGRLFADQGAWEFQHWSASSQKQYDVTVDHDKKIRTETSDEAEPPGRGQPVPTGWPDSPVIFKAVAPYVDENRENVVWALFNNTGDEPVWGLLYTGRGGSHRVTWDGVYVE